MRIEVTNPEKYTDVDFVVRTELSDRKGNVYGFNGDVDIEVNGVWKTFSGEHGLDHYEDEFGFIFVQDITLEQLRSQLKAALENCTHVNDGSLAAQVDDNIQWAWENWDFDYSDYTDDHVKPECYTEAFRDEWIDTAPFDVELERLNS